MNPEDTTQSPGSMLADEMYPPAEVDTPVAETPAEQLAAEPDPPPQDVSGEELGTDLPEPDATDDPNTIEVSTVEQLAEHFEFDPEWMENLEITQKVNGKEVQVQLSDALQTHRQVAAGDAYLADAKSKAKGIIDEANRSKDDFSESVATFGALLKNLEGEIDADVNSIDWATLRRDDPAEYAAKREEVRERKQRFDSLKADALNSYKGAVGNQTAAANKARDENLPKEYATFLERVPEWKDEDRASVERESLALYLRDEGYTENQITQASYNGKLMALSVKAMRYDQSKSKSQAAKKKVVRVPKVMKPGAKQAAAKPNGAGDDPASILYPGT
jgi:hypothetical protein